MDLAHLVGNAGVEQDSLSRRGFAGIDVRHDADISISLERGLSGHDAASGASHHR
jgi:hypothetical protein